MSKTKDENKYENIFFLVKEIHYIRGGEYTVMERVPLVITGDMAGLIVILFITLPFTPFI